MHQAVLRFRYQAPLSGAIAAALAPESEVSDVPKTRADISTQGEDVVVEVRADDLAALRAALNSYLRWVDAAERAAAAAIR